MSLLPSNRSCSASVSSTETPTVLVVSTSNNFMKLVTDAATSQNANLQYASHLSQATALMENNGQLCIVLDYQSPEVFDVPQIILKLREILALIVVSPENDPEAVFHAACMGALHVINRPVDILGVARVLGKVFTLNRVIVDRSHKRISEPLRQYTQLSLRQSQILRLLMRGEPNKAIASRMDLGLRTIEGERAKMMKKFRVQSLAELVRCATLAAEQLRHVRAREFMLASNESSFGSNSTVPVNAA